MKKTVPYITGDGVGVEITPSMQAIVNAAVKKAYGNEHEIEWMEVLAGERAFNETGSWLPDETMEAFKKYGVGIKGPLTTPVGGGIRSLNVALRQTLDLYVCLRPVRWFSGVVSPVKEPQKVDMHIFRENTEDIYAGIEWEAGTPEAEKFYRFLHDEMGVAKVYGFAENRPETIHENGRKHNMPRMSKKRKHELSFYLNDRGRVTYNELCRKCQHGCRQSFRAVVVDCPRYLSKRAKKKEEHTE